MTTTNERVEALDAEAAEPAVLRTDTVTTQRPRLSLPVNVNWLP
jgi:hypothetical protein